MSKALATKNVAAALLAVAMVVTFAFSFAKPAKADVLSDLQAQVQALLAQIASLQGSSVPAGAGCHTFTQTLELGATGGEVMWVQQFLNGHGAQVSATGAGSPGNESSYFGAKTKAAVAKWQAANAVSPAAGYWGPITRAKVNSICAGAPTGPVVTPTGPGVSVFAGSQPANSLAPAGASRVPFTTFTLTNNSGAAVTVTGVTVQRTGFGVDANFSGVMLVDSNGTQIGVSRTFDANHMAVIGDTMTLQAGQSVTLTVAGNIQTVANGNANGGQVVSIAVTGINTSAPVTGSLPITGAQQTINTTLTLGTVTASNSSFDPNSATNKSIGDTAIKFTAVRFTAGSAEDVKFYSIRWRTNGSVSPSDLGNVVTVVNGTSYPTTLSTDGRYYTAMFAGGVLVTKGNSIDVYVQGDLVGANSASRVVEFDLDKTSDVYFVGQTYGYGITPTVTASGSISTLSTHGTAMLGTNQPWLQGSTISIQGGTVTTIQNATAVASQNIAVNVPNVVLGGFQTNFSGEAVTVQGMKFYIGGAGTTTTDQITSVSIVDENGSVVAGPVDATANLINFTNSVTFQTGLHTYTLKGRIPSTGYPNGATVQLSTIPSGWTGAQGQLTGNSVAISTAQFTMNTMTIRGATLSIAASANPSSQNVVVGGQNVVLANIQLDASQSGEDVRINNLPLFVTEGTGDEADFLSNCAIWDGTTQLNTGSNVKNTITAGSNAFLLNNALTITKGTVKTLAVSCSISSGAPTSSRTIRFGVNTGSTFTATGFQSGSSLDQGTNLTITTTNSGLMTYSSGAGVSLTVDSSSPSYQIGAAGTTGVTVGVIKLRASNEAFNLTKLGLTTANGTYGSLSTGSGGAATAAGDLTTVYLYNSSGTLLGTATFVGANATATSSLNVPLAIARDVDTTITVKADLAQIGVSASGGIGNLIKVDPLNFEGTGASSGGTVRGSASGSNTAGVRLLKSYPTLALDTLPSTGVADGRLMRFKVTANTAGPVGISQFAFTVATTTASVTNVNLYGFTDSSYSQPVSGQGTGGLIGNQVNGVVDGSTAIKFGGNANAVQVPAGQTYYFELRASVSAPTNSSVVTILKGDTSYPGTLVSGFNVVTAVSASTTNAANFVWSGNSTTTSAIVGDIDFSNGFSVPGLPSSGLIQTRSN